MHGAVLSHNTAGPGNTMGELAFSSSSFLANAIFEDGIVGPTVVNNRLSRNARITMTDNNLGRFRVTASLLDLNFPVVSNVQGAVLSHNTVSY